MRALAFLALLVAATGARADEIAIALTEDLIEVDAGFFGARIVLFGVIADLEAQGAEPAAGPPGYDVVAVVKGPPTTFRLRPIERARLIWAAGPAIDVDAPGILLTLSTRPLEAIAPVTERRALRIGADAGVVAASLVPQSDAAAFHIDAAGPARVGAAFLEDGRRRGRIVEAAGAVTFGKAGLFSIEVALPPRTPVGDYTVDVYLFREGAVASRDSAALSVSKVGLERQVYEIAHRRPVSYGIGCVVIALAAGWLAAAAFRK